MSSRCPILAIFIITILLAVIPSACQPVPPVTYESPWKPGDLRILEAPNLPDPTYDLVGVYARLTRTDLELRFDFLGSPDPSAYHLYVAIDTGEEGKGGRLPLGVQPPIQWDIALGFPARSLPVVFNSEGEIPNIRPRIHRDCIQDAAIVRISRRELPGDPGDYRVFAYIVEPGKNQPADIIGPLHVGGPPPEAKAHLLIAFWDSFPVGTPAQALRRWSGAHTGPYGQRHGLSILLQAASQNGIPLALLDLKRSKQLSALETVGGIPLVQQMQKDNLLLLPDSSFGDPQADATSLLYSREAGQQFKLSQSAFRYGAGAASKLAGSNETFPYRGAFARLMDSTHLLAWNNLRLIPLPDPVDLENPQVNEEGLTVSVRTALLKAALNPDPAGLIVLGGDLPNSPWGDSLIASPAFRYIAGHPWIHAMNGDNLLRFPAVVGAPACPDLLCLPAQDTDHLDPSQIIQGLPAAPEGLFRDLAWQTYLRLTEPTSDERLRALRAGYLGQVGALLAAARWNADPSDQSTCAADWNWDGAPECILSSKTIFLAIDPSGGRLVLAAARYKNDVYELIGPRSQFVVGLGDPSEWHPERGLMGDPQEISGAFTDPLDPLDPTDRWKQYNVETQPGEVILINPHNGSQKTYQLAEAGFQLRMMNQQPYQTHLPLVIIGSGSYKPGAFSRYQSISIDNNTLTSNPIYVWQLRPDLSVRCRISGAQITVDTFTDSRLLMTQPEDPNTGFPPGHFLPFPFSLIHLQSTGDFTVDLQLEQP